MLGHSIFEDGVVTFVNLSTGRFIRKKISNVIKNYFFVGVTTGGLFVLGKREQPYQTRVLNPFTGAMVDFKAAIPKEQVGAVVVTSSPMRVFITSLENSMKWIDQSDEDSPSGQGFQDQDFPAAIWHGCLVGMTPFAGDVYVIDRDVSILSATDAAAAKKSTLGKRRQCSAILRTTSRTDACGGKFFYLVESEGELLLVIDCMSRVASNGGTVVYKVDSMNKVLVPVSSIGSQALFVSKYRCLSIDAKKFHTVEAGNIYYADYFMVRTYDHESLTGGGWKAEPEYVAEFEPNREDCSRPFTLAQLFLDYCRTVEYSELETLLPKRAGPLPFGFV
jgi:hypothetical protein